MWLIAVFVGILLTFISGACQVRLPLIDAELVNFGFPFAWLQRVRGKPLIMTPWRYRILWSGFILDTLAYSTIVFLASIIYFARRQPRMSHLLPSVSM